MLETHSSLHTRLGQLHHRVEAIRLALAGTALTDDVRVVLTEHLRTAEEALAAVEAESPISRDAAI